MTRLLRQVRWALGMILRGEFAELRFQVLNHWRGVDLEYVATETLGLPAERAHFHSQSGGGTLDAIFRSLPIPPGSVALDLGSGKGGAMITLRRLPFDEVIGVELSPDLVRVAETNMARLGLTRVRFFAGDAAAFGDLDAVTHVYMYNPFPCPVMAEVVANLAASLRRRPRTIFVVYRNPLCKDLLARSGVLHEVRTLSADRHDWIIYSSRVGSAQGA